MIDGSAPGSRAIGDASRRDLASEWTGPEPAAPQAPFDPTRVHAPEPAEPAR